ncbi:hypothetical protein REPUB_Repub17cG0135600 [Reevesia pubescens]
MSISLVDIGFRFLPPDEQIISIFLLNKMKGSHESTRHIREVDLLRQEPWELPGLSIVRSTYKEWFFFYKLNKISEKKNDRTTEAGFWKSTGKDRDINYGGRVIGSKKTLVFYIGRPAHGVKTDWVMHEFRASANFIPPKAENNYVVGYLRDNSAENTENSISNDGQPSTHFAASSSQSDAVGVTPMEVAPQLQSNSMDYELALQTQMEDEGIFAYDLPPSNGLLDHPSSIAITNNDQSSDEGGLSLEDLGLILSNNTIEQEMNFMTSTFPKQDECSYGENRYPRAPYYAGDSSDTDPEWGNASSDQNVFMSDCTGHGRSGGFNEKRMENGVHHDDILIMDSSVDSATVTAYEINCLESVQEERSVNSRTCKSRYEPRSHKSVVQRHPRRVQLQGKSLGKTVSRDETRESSVRGPVVEPVRNKKSIVQSNKGPKMDGDRNKKSDMNLRSKGSAGSSRKNSFNFLEMSQLSSKQNQPLVYIRNVLLGVILFIFVVMEVMYLH